MTSGTLREALSADPSSAAWGRILAAISGPEDIDAAEIALQAWPDEVRAAPPGTWDQIERGLHPPAWWPLVRMLTLDTGEALRPQDALRAIRILDLGRDADSLDLDDLAGLSALRDVRMWGGTLTDLTPFAALPGLDSLDIEGATLLTDLTPISGLAALTRLRLRGAAELCDVRPLARLNELRTLLLADCPSLVDLAPLAGLPSLAYVDLSGSPNAVTPDRWRAVGVTVMRG